MRAHLRVINEDGTAADVTATAADFVEYEEHYNRSAARIATETRFGDMAFLAWSALSRGKRTSLDYKTWLVTIDTVTVRDEAASVDPLEMTANTGS